MEESRRYTREAIEYISKLSEGGLRDAITMLDKCLSLSTELTVENIVKALGVADYDIMMKLTDALWSQPNREEILDIIEGIHNDGKDLKQFIKQYVNFILDIKKFIILNEFDYISIPETAEMKEWLTSHADYAEASDILDLFLNINTEIKYDSSPKYMIEAMILSRIDY